jgi:hypothetical protein
MNKLICLILGHKWIYRVSNLHYRVCERHESRLLKIISGQQGLIKETK